MAIIDTTLRDSLRALKLSGMLHTLDARLVQAQAGELGHLEFLQVLCHDEIGRRDTMSHPTPTPPSPVRPAVGRTPGCPSAPVPTSRQWSPPCGSYAANRPRSRV